VRFGDSTDFFASPSTYKSHLGSRFYSPVNQSFPCNQNQGRVKLHCGTEIIAIAILFGIKVKRYRKCIEQIVQNNEGASQTHWSTRRCREKQPRCDLTIPFVTHSSNSITALASCFLFQEFCWTFILPLISTNSSYC
jgi:hypothetical protein